MHATPLTTAIDVRRALRSVEPEFYDDRIPVAATQRRMLVLTEAAAAVIVSHCGKLPENQTRLLTWALTVIVSRRDLGKARDLIGEALEIVPSVAMASSLPSMAP